MRTAGMSRIDPGNPPVYFAQYAQQFYVMRPVLVVHAGHSNGGCLTLTSELWAVAGLVIMWALALLHDAGYIAPADATKHA
jgi:hypothetical protein